MAKAPFVSLRGWKTDSSELVLGTGGRGPQAPVRPSGPCCFGVAKAPFCEPLRLEDRQLRASFFLVGSESNVRHWGPWPAGPVRPSGPCCFGVAKAPFVSLCGWKTGSSELVFFLSVQKATLGTGGRGPQARSVLQGPAVSVWRRRRL